MRTVEDAPATVTALFLQDLDDLADVHAVVIAGFVCLCDFGCQEIFRLEIIKVYFFTDEHKLRFFKIGGAAVGKTWRQTGLFDLVDIAAALGAAVKQHIPVFLTIKAQRIVFAVIHELPCVPLRSDKTERDSLLP